MVTPLSPTAEEIQALDDEQLRELLDQLAKAELVEAGLPVSALLSGGHQFAPDGGRDLIVDWDDNRRSDQDFLVRLPIGIQSKAEAMGPQKIKKEMAPKGKPREMLAILASRHGAYVIASNKDSCAPPQLEARLRAMREVVDTVPNGSRLHLDFYDRKRLLHWVDRHPGPAMWLAREAGRPRQGWFPFGPWSNPREAIDEPYIDTGTTRVYLDEVEPPVSVADALTELRGRLSLPRNVVRLVGVSGTGKTRLAQALFDTSIGERALSSSLAVYADAANDSAALDTMIGHWLSRRERAVLVVDNCPDTVHRRLTDAVMARASQLSLITIDFDIGPKGLPDTSVARLEVADGDVIDQLLRRRYPKVSMADRERIVRFAQGNSRIALALARGARHGLANLEDTELLDRLFLVNRRHGNDLKLAASAASLVYAWDTIRNDSTVESQRLAALADTTEIGFSNHVYQLMDRGLVQKRGTERALLPPGLAAHLATEAFARLPPGVIERNLLGDAPFHLQKSFVKRLRLLHNSPGAVALTRRLMAAGLPFPGSSWSDENRWWAWMQLAPVVPDLALASARNMIEAASANDLFFRLHAHSFIAPVLESIAYETEDFRAAVEALTRLTITAPDGDQESPSTGRIRYLFRLNGSGTLAPPEERFFLLEQMLGSIDDATRKLGINCLDQALQVGWGSRRPKSDFGARLRTFGWHPADSQQYLNWYDQALTIAEHYLKYPTMTEAILPRLGYHLTNLVVPEVLRPRAAQSLRTLRGLGYGAEAWFAVCRRLNTFAIREEAQPTALRDLEAELRPSTLEERYDVFVLASLSRWKNPYPDKEDNSFDAFVEQGRQLGRDLASNPETRRVLVLRTIGNPNANGRALGEGIAESERDLGRGWDQLVDLYRKSLVPPTNISSLAGYVEIAAKKAPKVIDCSLDHAAADAVTAPWMVDLHIAAGLRKPVTAAAHMLEGLRNGSISPSRFEILEYGRYAMRLPNRMLSQIVAQLALSPDGLAIAIEIIGRRYALASERKLDGSLVRAGQEILFACADAPVLNIKSYNLRLIAKRSLEHQSGRAAAQALARRFMDPASQSLGIEERRELLTLIFRHHPDMALDVFFGDKHAEPSDDGWSVLDGDDVLEQRILAIVPDERLKAWVAQSPSDRATQILPHVPLFRRQEGVISWAPVALWLFDQQSVTRSVLMGLRGRFFNAVWNGDARARNDQFRRLASDLVGHKKAAVAALGLELLAIVNEQQKTMEARTRSQAETFDNEY